MNATDLISELTRIVGHESFGKESTPLTIGWLEDILKRVAENLKQQDCREQIDSWND